MISSHKFPLWSLILIMTLGVLCAFVLTGWSFFAPQILAFTTFTPHIQKTESIGPRESIVITFPQPVLDSGYRERIRITPSLPFYAKWEERQTKLLLTPQTHWEPETAYSMLLPEGDTSHPFSAKPQSTPFTFAVASHPKVLKVTPANETQNFLIDIEDPITVDFDVPTHDFWIDFSFSPAIETTFENNPEKTQFKILPKAPLAVGTKYTLTISSRIRGEERDTPKILSQTTFTTLLPAPKEISKDPTEKLAQAKQFTPPPLTEGKCIDVNLATQTMVIFENGIALDAYLVSSGKKGMDTPTGSFQIHNKAPKPWSKTYSLFMPNWMAITSDGKVGIHELPEWPGGYKEGANHLGTPVSHGCVRLGVGPAKRVYDWAEVGTPVIIH